MKKILFYFFVLIIVGCTPKEHKQNLPGSFKYLSYYWNNSKDSVGLSLVHYLDISKDGNYHLIQRVNDDSTGYYYGVISNSAVNLLKQFMGDSASRQENHLRPDTTAKTLRNKFDFTDSLGTRKITFTSDAAPAGIAKIQAVLDSVIASPDKKRGRAYNIDAYLKKLIAADSSLNQ